MNAAIRWFNGKGGKGDYGSLQGEVIFVYLFWCHLYQEWCLVRLEECRTWINVLGKKRMMMMKWGAMCGERMKCGEWWGSPCLWQLLWGSQLTYRLVLFTIPWSCQDCSQSCKIDTSFTSHLSHLPYSCCHGASSIGLSDQIPPCISCLLYIGSVVLVLQ